MGQMTPALCIEAVAQLIDTIPAAGTQIHRQRKMLRDERRIRELCFDAGLGRICAWFISPAASNTTVTTRNPGFVGIGVQGGGNNLYVMQFQVEVYFGLDEANDSEQAFTALVWSVVDKINSYGGLAGITGLVEQLPADIETYGYAMLAGVPLVHFARVSVAFRGR